MTADIFTQRYKPVSSDELGLVKKKGEKIGLDNPFFRIDYEKNPHFSFFFTAIFSSLILAVLAAVDDYLDELIMEHYRNNHHRRMIKIGVHVGVMFVITLVLIYIFRILWGPVYL